MKRKTVIIFTVLAMILVSAAFVVSAHGDAPAEVTIDGAMKKKPPVVFPHEAHARDIDCSVCHHTSKGKDDITSCFECHGKDPKTNDPTVSSPKVNPFHIVCRGCHKEQAKGPTKCGDCHKKI